jgi:hypothetical protein
MAMPWSPPAQKRSGPRVRLFTETPVRTLLRGRPGGGRVLNPQGNGSMFAPGEVSCWLVVASPRSAAHRAVVQARPMAPNI